MEKEMEKKKNMIISIETLNEKIKLKKEKKIKIKNLFFMF